MFRRAPLPPVFRRGIARLIVVVDVAVAVSHPRQDAPKIGATFFAFGRRKPGAIDEAVAGLVVVGARCPKIEAVIASARRVKWGKRLREYV